MKKKCLFRKKLQKAVEYIDKYRLKCFSVDIVGFRYEIVCFCELQDADECSYYCFLLFQTNFKKCCTSAII